MLLKRRRFDHFSREEAIALLEALEGPLLELWFGMWSEDADSDVMFGEIMHAFNLDPQFDPVLPSGEEIESWERFEGERGGAVEMIGEFIYGPDENPWRH